MHFMGPDQRRGFEERYVGDFTPCYHGRYGKVRVDLGPYVGTPAGDFAKHYGGATSPVIEYDRDVVRFAIDLLKQPHDRPLFLMVGIYGPHYTYVGPDDLYRKYLDLLPAVDTDDEEGWSHHPLLDDRTREFDRDVVRRLRVAYCGMVEQVDQQFGILADAWSEFARRRERDDLVCYLSDHGDQIGEKRQWGKMTFYEPSVAIPMVFGASAVRARGRVSEPVSSMDLSPTLGEVGHAPRLPDQDGVSQLSLLKSDTALTGTQDRVTGASRTVLSELLQTSDPPVPARMVRQGHWKYVTYAGYEEHDLLSNLADDPDELHNLRDDHPVLTATLAEEARRGWDPNSVVREHERRSAHWEILSLWGANAPVREPDRWKVPESSWELPRP